MASAIGSLFVSLGVDTAEFGKGLKNAESSVSKFGAFAKKGLLAVGAAVAGAGAAMGVAVTKTINAADEMSKSAQKFGVPIEELSRLKYAADLSGVSFEGLGNGLKRLSANMNDAKNGTGEGAKAFEQLGIKVTDAEGKLKTSTAIMAEMADKFQAMPDGAEKTALAMDLMGKSGANMIPLLNSGSAALNKLTAEADSFGQVFTQEMGSSAEAFNDNMSRLSGAFMNLAAGIAKELLPHLKTFSDWLVDNAPQIIAFAKSAIEGFVAFVGVVVKLATAINDTATALTGFDTSLRQWGENVRNTVRKFADDIIAIFNALPGQMLLIGQQIIDGLWTGLKSKYTEVKNSVTGFASGLVDSVKSTLGIQSPSTEFHEIGVDLMQGFANGIIDGSTTVKDAVMNLLKSLAKMFLDFGFKSLLGGIGGGSGGLLSSLFGGLSLPGFASGGSFTVGGTGGIDSQLVALRASPGERVDIRKPGQMGGSETIHIELNPSEGWVAGVADKRIQTRAGQIIQVSVRESQKQTRRNFGGLAAEFQARAG